MIRSTAWDNSFSNLVSETGRGDTIEELGGKEGFKYVKSVCGRRPVLKKKREEWTQCANTAIQVYGDQMGISDTGGLTSGMNRSQQQASTKTWVLIGVAGVVTIGLIAIVARRSR